MPALCSAISTLALLVLLFVGCNGAAFLALRVLPLRLRPRKPTVVATVSISLAVVLVGLFWFFNRPAGVFRQVFGEWPSSDVAMEHSQYFSFADSGDAHLVFKCNETTADRLA